LCREGPTYLAFLVFFPGFENNFEAGFSGAEVYDVLRFHLAIAAEKIGSSSPRKVGLKITF
jgi:hypothetical protein